MPFDFGIGTCRLRQDDTGDTVVAGQQKPKRLVVAGLQLSGFVRGFGCLMNDIIPCLTNRPLRIGKVIQELL